MIDFMVIRYFVQAVMVNTRSADGSPHSIHVTPYGCG